MLTIESGRLQQLLAALTSRGYELYGPTVRNGAIVVDRLSSAGDLPVGWSDTQDAGSYALAHGDGTSMFGYTLGPIGWKHILSPPRLSLFKARRAGHSFEVEASQPSSGEDARKIAFIGIRSCEIQALGLQDRVFMNTDYTDPTYAANRRGVFVVAVDCAHPGGTCFCASLGTGPFASKGFDLALTEFANDGENFFAVRSGSPRGEELLKQLEGRKTSKEDAAKLESMKKDASSGMKRHVDIKCSPAHIDAVFEHAGWDDVAKRCLACTNCTMVCPTCFCSTVEDFTDLTGTTAERQRRWDSCYAMDFSRVAGGNIRPSTKARHRQWLMHKFFYWIEQFGVTGCVGCGRCITWCPAGIDITETLREVTEGIVRSGKNSEKREEN